MFLITVRVKIYEITGCGKPGNKLFTCIVSLNCNGISSNKLESIYSHFKGSIQGNQSSDFWGNHNGLSNKKRKGMPLELIFLI